MAAIRVGGAMVNGMKNLLLQRDRQVAVQLGWVSALYSGVQHLPCTRAGRLQLSGNEDDAAQ